MEQHNDYGLVLSGGGARGAYQAGVLKAVEKIVCQRKSDASPFSVLSGSSAGAINTGFVAAKIDNFSIAIRDLCLAWSNITSQDVYKINTYAFLKNFLQWIAQLSLGSFYKEKKSRFLFDTSPLASFLKAAINEEKIHSNITEGKLKALAITAFNYSSGFSEVFFDSTHSIEGWKRFRREGIRTNIHLKHISASASIPLLFPPVEINGHYYGDGGLRNYTPLSAAIKLGARKLFVVAVRKKKPLPDPNAPVIFPSLARVIGLVLNSVFLDSIDIDLERLEYINQAMHGISSHEEAPFRNIDFCVVRPSEDLGKLAEDYSEHFPRTVSYLLKGLGNQRESSDLLSYLLFEPSFTKRLISLGYHDTMAKKKEILHFFGR